MSASRSGILPMAVIRHLHRDKRGSTIFKCARAKWLYSLGTGTPATFRSQLLAMENKVFIHFDLSINHPLKQPRHKAQRSRTGDAGISGGVMST